MPQDQIVAVKPEAGSLEAQAAEAYTRYEAADTRDALAASHEMLAASQEMLAASRDALAAERAAGQVLFEHAPDGYLVTNSVGLVLRANKMAGELFGVPRERLVNKPITVFVTLAERGAFRKLLLKISGRNGGMFAFDGHLEARGGRTFAASVRVSSGGDELRWTIRDVTDEHRAQRSLFDAHQRLEQRTHELESEITDREQADTSLRRSEERYRMLSAHLHEGIEEERARIAREVHDELGSALTAIRFELSDLRSAAQGDDAVRRAIGRVDAAIRATRRICSGLRPSLLDHMGLWAAIEWFIEDMAGRSGIQCKVDLAPGTELGEPARTSVFRIVQEAVTNTVRHAKASSLRVSARDKAGELEIQVADDGRGIRPAELTRPDAFGITGMQERARACGGRIVIEPAEKGTRILLRVPLAAEGTACAS